MDESNDLFKKIMMLGKRKKRKLIDNVLLLSRQSFAPPEKITVSEWAEKYRILSSSSSAISGHWKNAQTPHMRDVMDLFNDKDIEIVVVKSCAQMAKSEVLLNVIGYTINLDPCPILLLQPTISAAQSFSKDRVAAMFRDTPIFDGLVDSSTSRQSGNTILHKQFKGGQLTIAGANSPTELASRPIKVLLIDEVDRMGNTSEGDPVNIAMKRTATFFDRKIFLVSTPTLAEFSRIDKAYLTGDQRKRFIPCPKCDTFQVLEFENIEYDREKPNEAQYKCIECNHLWTEAERIRQLHKGEWRATSDKGRKGVASFEISELYSMWRSIGDIVVAYVACGEDENLLQVFNNTVLGRVHVTKIDSEIKAGELPVEDFDRKIFPDRAEIITAGIDVHAKRIMVEVVAWGKNYESWSLAYDTLHGDTSDSLVWDTLKRYLGQYWPTDLGGRVGIKRVAIDLGYNTYMVKRFISQNKRQVIGVKGRANSDIILSTPNLIDSARFKKDKSGVLTYMVGVDILKEELYGFLRRKATEIGGKIIYPNGYCHFPSDRDRIYFKELVAEKRIAVTINGRDTYKWIRPKGVDNEAMDCRIYARAALYHTGYDRKVNKVKKKIRPKLNKKENILDF